jgi:hypothetical protein
VDDVIRLEAVLSGVAEHWAPRRVGTVNDYDVKVVKVLGEFVEHAHADTDEFFLVLDGELVIDLPDREVRLGPRHVRRPKGRAAPATGAGRDDAVAVRAARRREHR